LGPEGQANAKHIDRHYNCEGGPTDEFLKFIGVRLRAIELLTIVNEIARECMRDGVCVTEKMRIHGKVMRAGYAWLDCNWDAIKQHFARKVQMLQKRKDQEQIERFPL
jgi:hypothetical protein